MRLLLVVAMLAACKGDKPAEIDANPAGPRCSARLYDLCIEEHDCLDGDAGVGRPCQNFAADGIQVCTEACTPGGAPCPDDRTGTPATCESNVCKPSVANMCHL